MKKYFFVALVALTVCSCINQAEEPSCSSSVVEKSDPRDKVYTAKVLRVQQIIERLGNSCASKTVLLFDDGNLFSFRDEYHQDQCLLREGDEVEYTKTSDGKVWEIVRCVYRQTTISEE